MPSKRQTLKFRGNKEYSSFSKGSNRDIVADIEIVRVKDFTPERFGYNILLHYYDKNLFRSETAYTFLEAKIKATYLWTDYVNKPNYLK